VKALSPLASGSEELDSALIASAASATSQPPSDGTPCWAAVAGWGTASHRASQERELLYYYYDDYYYIILFLLYYFYFYFYYFYYSYYYSYYY
jgi:hypothetical protein